ncbi:nucleotide sugar dehydrogenase [Serratia sp. UGAL515B_01]|uniref:nucleotide sugar dehydrogenase n=1 Tax=Serratia sp. UGAL515B_01 TaxID=2986763 RepID=UPI002955A218|nr:nucleotide sugar dehydrogenase [Serratia sp. UGAL515B_01]WON78276.1 nucleotide sugar dehydrogenase [Serratia sp. UGAL515B_01]
MFVKNIAVCGLGYVGLPVSIALARHFDVIGFDVDSQRVSRLRDLDDWTGEITPETLAKSTLQLTSRVEDLKGCNFFIVAVPTPIDERCAPDFTMLKDASRLIGSVLTRGSTVVFESTVYPGATEEICGPELEKSSGLRCGVDFKLGYSPERINPGDTDHPFEKIVKVVSGQDKETLELVASVYETVVEAGVFRASSIKVAEAAKVLENTQRDINIALMNEMSKICALVDINTSEVLKAAGTKWNFMNFTPGLVGGHCIGVDPYYLTSKAQQLGYHPEVILAGRRINDSMAEHVASKLIQVLAHRKRLASTTRVGVVGITFKENVPDIRNSKVVDLYNELGRYGINPHVCDPLADPVQTKREYGITLVEPSMLQDLDMLILAVPHKQSVELVYDKLNQMVAKDGVVCDLRSVLEPSRLRSDVFYWTL